MKRNSSLDALRILAAFFVIVIHTSGSASTAATLWNIAARFSVPAFVILSGYYLLPSDKSLARRGGRLFAQMLLWAAVYYAYSLADGAAYAGVGDAVRQLLTEPVHLWYVYAILGLYLFTPMLRLFHRYADQALYRYTLAVTFVLGSVVTLALRMDVPILAAIVDRSKLACTLAFPCMYLLGGYFRKFPEGQSLRFFGITGAAALAAACGITVFAPGRISVELFYSFYSPNAILTAAALFLLALRVERIPCPAVTAELSACTLGVYFAHPLVMRMGQDALARLAPLPDVLETPVKAALVFAVTTACVWLWRRGAELLQKLRRQP